MKVSFWLDNQEFRLSLEEKNKDTILANLNGKEYVVSVDFFSSDEFLMSIDNRVHDVIVSSNSSGLTVFFNGRSYTVAKKSASQILGKQSVRQKKQNVKTSMPGRIVKLLLQEGDRVEQGQAVLILEAMKMENEMKSPQSGIITRLDSKPGDYVETGSTLFTVE